MSAERYEIKGKIGQGGVGAVYQAFDTQLNREVAIKRVLADGSYDDKGEATKHLLKEATALSSVQHPHIVTVYDAGIDDEGPYVVMELIHGRTLDEMVERGTLTWDDLREVALQTQEALIAAQDLDLVHRDLKPSNVMVCWLPSGKFQVKIVDFGLAKFSATPSLQTIDHGDAVFGSIFFMAPEQFERTPLDKRTDMYAMGCLYYYALTGEYPFSGDTAAAVMASHLQHHVKHLKEARPDIPQWGAEWIMWHIGRYMDERPNDAREALERFLVLDKQSTQPISMSATDPNAGGQPQFVFPGAAAGGAAPVPGAQPAAGAQPISLQAPEPAAQPIIDSKAVPLTPPTEGVTAGPANQTAPQPIAPPDGALSPHTQAQNLDKATQSATGPQPTQTATGPQPTQTATGPQPDKASQPVTASATTSTSPVSLTGTAPQPALAASSPVQQSAAAGAIAGVAGAAANPAAMIATRVANLKKTLPPGAKWAIIGMLALVVIVTIIVMVSIGGERSEAKAYNALMERADLLEKEGKLDDGLELSENELNALLKNASSMEDNKKRVILRKCLAFAKGKDFEADPIIVSYITTALMPESLRADLFKYVMARRKNPSNIAPLLEYAKNSAEVSSATQAIKAAQASAKGTNADDYFPDFLELINNAEADSIKTAAEAAASELVASSENKEEFGSRIMGSYEAAVEDSAKFALLRLLGAAGGQKSSKVINEALKSDNEALKNAAIAALGRWADDNQFDTLTGFISDTHSDRLRQKAFDAAYSFLRLERKREPEELGDLWRMLAGVAQSQREKLQVIRGMANQKHEWAIPVLEYFSEDKDDHVVDRADRAKELVERRIRERDND